ncbi:hypothetical protein N9937_00055 [bacterium]|nr:hypothetical protein [bacterium]
MTTSFLNFVTKNNTAFLAKTEDDLGLISKFIEATGMGDASELELWALADNCCTSEQRILPCWVGINFNDVANPSLGSDDSTWDLALLSETPEWKPADDVLIMERDLVIDVLVEKFRAEISK